MYYIVLITFANNKLRKWANDYKKSRKEQGEKRAKLYQKRLNDLQSAASLADVKNLPGGYHELVADRKGQWACDLDQPYRLIFEPIEDPIDSNKKFIWSEIKGVKILLITNYHGK